MAQITISNLTFAYEGSYDTIFEDVSFRIDSDWKLGFTGRNGRGKTTFLNLLQGKYPYSGTISTNLSFEYFPFPVQDDTQQTIDILYQINPYLELWELQRELSLLEVEQDVLYRPFYTLSNGERTKVLLAALFLKDNSYLLIDEPTNHLDTWGRELVSRYLKSKKGFILVSHDRRFLDDTVDHILSINKTNIEVQQGNFSSWWENKELQDAYELAQNEKLKKDIKRLSAAAKRTETWSDKVEQTKYGTRNAGLRVDRGFIGHKSAKMMKRSKNIIGRQQDLIQEKGKLLKNLEQAEPLKITPLVYHSASLLNLKNVSLRYGEKVVCKDVSFTVNRGDRIALQGKNGSGKSTVLKLLCGEEIAYTGDFYRGSGLKLSYISQDTSYLQGDLKAYSKACGIDESLFKAILRKLDFSRVQFEKDMADFSEGQKKKVLIARSLSEQAHLYIWDEPLNFIDILSRMQIEQLLLDFQPTILFVEHDRAFCQDIATETVLLS